MVAVTPLNAPEAHSENNPPPGTGARENANPAGNAQDTPSDPKPLIERLFALALGLVMEDDEAETKTQLVNKDQEFSFESANSSVTIDRRGALNTNPTDAATTDINPLETIAMVTAQKAKMMAEGYTDYYPVTLSYGDDSGQLITPEDLSDVQKNMIASYYAAYLKQGFTIENEDYVKQALGLDKNNFNDLNQEIQDNVLKVANAKNIMEQHGQPDIADQLGLIDGIIEQLKGFFGDRADAARAEAKAKAEADAANKGASSESDPAEEADNVGTDSDWQEEPTQAGTSDPNAQDADYSEGNSAPKEQPAAAPAEETPPPPETGTTENAEAGEAPASEGDPDTKTADTDTPTNVITLHENPRPPVTEVSELHTGAPALVIDLLPHHDAQAAHSAGLSAPPGNRNPGTIQTGLTLESLVSSRTAPAAPNAAPEAPIINSLVQVFGLDAQTNTLEEIAFAAYQIETLYTAQKQAQLETYKSIQYRDGLLEDLTHEKATLAAEVKELNALRVQANKYLADLRDELLARDSSPSAKSGGGSALASATTSSAPVMESTEAPEARATEPRSDTNPTGAPEGMTDEHGKLIQEDVDLGDDDPWDGDDTDVNPEEAVVPDASTINPTAADLSSPAAPYENVRPVPEIAADEREVEQAQISANVREQLAQRATADELDPTEFEGREGAVVDPDFDQFDEKTLTGGITQGLGSAETPATPAEATVSPDFAESTPDTEASPAPTFDPYEPEDLEEWKKDILQREDNGVAEGGISAAIGGAINLKDQDESAAPPPSTQAANTVSSVLGESSVPAQEFTDGGDTEAINLDAEDILVVAVQDDPDTQPNATNPFSMLAQTPNPAGDSTGPLVPEEEVGGSLDFGSFDDAAPASTQAAKPKILEVEELDIVDLKEEEEIDLSDFSEAESDGRDSTTEDLPKSPEEIPAPETSAVFQFNVGVIYTDAEDGGDIPPGFVMASPEQPKSSQHDRGANTTAASAQVSSEQPPLPPSPTNGRKQTPAQALADRLGPTIQERFTYTTGHNPVAEKVLSQLEGFDPEPPRNDPGDPFADSIDPS